jgi:hypothetical protein
LTSEHRFAPPGPSLTLTLVTDQTPTRLQLTQQQHESSDNSLRERILVSLRSRPRRQDELRRELRVRNQYLTNVLRELQSVGWIDKSTEGWRLVRQP